MLKNPVIVILILPLILVTLWFREGNIMATGESGIPFYDLSLQYEINKSAWAVYTLGHPTNISIAGAPTYYFLSLIQKGGVPSYIIQALFLWIVLAGSGFGVYFLTKQFFPDLPKKYLILATLFYWFNPFAMVNVWNRFLNNFLMFYTLLPLACWVFIVGLKTKRFIFSILVGLISTLFSYALTSIVFVVLFWVMLGYIAAFNLIFKDSKGGEKFFTVKFFLLTLFFWIFVNFWWLNQMFSYLMMGSFDVVASSSFTPERNYHTLTILSERLGNVLDILRLRHGMFFNDAQIFWNRIYNLAPVKALEIVMIILMLVGAILGRKNLDVLFFFGLFLGSAFLAKGNNPPFGEVVSFIFWKFPVLQLFRNPFEKFGFLLIFAAAPLFAWSMHLLLKRLRRWQMLLYLTVILFLFIWSLPLLTAVVFTSKETPTNDPNIGYQVKVPAYYKEAGDWLKQQKEDFRIIALPIGGEGITYKWEKGYSGVELTNQLLPKTSISFITNIPFYEKVSRRIEEAFLNKGEFGRIMNVLNAKYIMERDDIDWQARGMRDPNSIHLQILEKERMGQLRKVAEFGKLSFWENTNWKDEKISVAPRVVLSSPESNILDFQITEYPTVVSAKKPDDTGINNLIVGEIIHPQAKFTLGVKPKGIFEIRQDLFPHVNVLPSSRYYQAILIKDIVEINALRNLEDVLRLSLNTLGKRLVEAKFESDRGNAKGAVIATEQYKKLLDSTLELSKSLMSVSQHIITHEELYSIFFQHLSVLENIKHTFTNNDTARTFLGDTIDYTRGKLVSFGISPSFGFKETGDFPIKGRVLYQFDVRSEGDFELKWGRQFLNNYFEIEDGDQFLLQVDDQILTRRVSLDEDNFVSLGKIDLKPGIHEIGLNIPAGKNLVSAPVEVNLKVDHGEKIIKFPIQNLDPNSTYSLTFKYWIKSGSGLTILLEGNNSQVKNGVVVPSLVDSMGPNFYDFTPKDYFTGLQVSTGADSASLILKVEPWNNCEDIFKTNRRRCQDENFRKAYDRTTEVLVSGIKVTRDLEDKPFLIKRDLEKEKITLPVINFAKIAPTEYSASVKDAALPFILIFSELFDPGWEVYYEEDKKETLQHLIVNSFANGWFIDKKGSFNLSIKYEPQKLLMLGEQISLISFTGGIIVFSSVVFKGVKRKKHG